MLKATLEFDLKTIDDLAKFKDDFRQEIIERGLDQPLEESLTTIQQELKTFVNEEVRERKHKQRPFEAQQGDIDIPKSEETILKTLFGINVDKFAQPENHADLGRSKIVFAHGSSNVGGTGRVRLRVPMRDGSTPGDHKIAATKFFNDSVYAMRSRQGNMNYYINPGVNVDNYVKVVCSTDTYDFETGEPITEKTKKRFDQYKENTAELENPHAEWTLKQGFVNDIPKKFLNVTAIVNEVKNGNIDRAREILNKRGATARINEIKGRLDRRLKEIQEKVDVAPDEQSYLEIIDLITNFKISKRIGKSEVTYTLTSSVSPSNKGTEKFLDVINTRISRWISVNQDIWFKKLVNKVDTLIKRYEA